MGKIQKRKTVSLRPTIAVVLDKLSEKFDKSPTATVEWLLECAAESHGCSVTQQEVDEYISAIIARRATTARVRRETLRSRRAEHRDKYDRVRDLAQRAFVTTDRSNA